MDNYLDTLIIRIHLHTIEISAVPGIVNSDFVFEVTSTVFGTRLSNVYIV